MRLHVYVPAAAMALAPSGAFAVDYMTAEQAQKMVFTQAEVFEQRDIALPAALQQKLRAGGVEAPPATVQVRRARRGDAVLGYVVVDEVIGKFERITYAVGVDRAGAVLQVEILSYRESHGHEIRLPAWRRQFAGKTAVAPLQVGQDIANISGATLSCSHVTAGVRKIVRTLDALRQAGTIE